VLESKEELEREIRAKVEEDDEDARDWRQWHPAIGVYSRGQSCVLPFASCVGFCPKCHEPLTERAIFKSQSFRGWGLECTACRIRDGIDQLEDRHRHPFHVLPFTQTALRDVIGSAPPMKDPRANKPWWQPPATAR
jgi:hypothetical protein